MDEAIRILEKEIEMIEGVKDNPFFGEDTLDELFAKIPEIKRAIWCLKNLVE